MPVLPSSALLPCIHDAWPFILRRLSDAESFVVRAAISLVESLADRFGSFMTRRIWDDVWPIFRGMLDKLSATELTSALARRPMRGSGGVGTKSAYTHSHRLYLALIRTMCAALRNVHPQDAAVWQVILAFRRFLDKDAHEELQACARDLYVVAGMNNKDAVWLALSSTTQANEAVISFLIEPKLDIKRNVEMIIDV